MHISNHNLLYKKISINFSSLPKLLKKKSKNIKKILIHHFKPIYYYKPIYLLIHHYTVNYSNFQVFQCFLGIFPQNSPTQILSLLAKQVF